MRRREPLRRYRGFSVLELLVAMAIIATLLMIVLPAYRNWSEKSEAAAVAELIHNVNLGVAEYATSTGNYPDADGFGFSSWGSTPASLTQFLQDADFRGPRGIQLAYWYVEPPHPHGPPQLRRPPHPFNGNGLHLGWADTGASSTPNVVSGGGTGGGGTDSVPNVPPPNVPQPNVPPPGGNPPGDKPPVDANPPGDKPGDATPSPGGTGTSSTGDKKPIIFGGPTGSPGDCDPAIFDDCGPAQPQVATSVPDNPPRVGYVAVRAPNGEGHAVLRRLMKLYPADQVRALDPAPEVILVRLQE